MNFPTLHDDDDEMRMTPKQRYDRYAARKNREIAEQLELAERIMVRMRNLAWDVDTHLVMANLPWFRAWADGLIKAGHLANRLALKRMTRSAYAEWSKHMTIPKAVMLDTVGSAARNIPQGTPYVAGYVSGSGVVPWSGNEWGLFPHSRKVRIWQNFNEHVAPTMWDVVDMETNALDAAEVAQAHKEHVDAGIQWTCVYATRTNLALATAAIKQLPDNYWADHVVYWLADWNLSEETASPLIGTFIEGAICIGVQWASPTSNPNTIVPGGAITLATANVDISIVDANWIPSVSFTNSPVIAPPVTEHHGELVTDDGHGGFISKPVSSTDDTHWQ